MELRRGRPQINRHADRQLDALLARTVLKDVCSFDQSAQVGDETGRRGSVNDVVVDRHRQVESLAYLYGVTDDQGALAQSATRTLNESTVGNPIPKPHPPANMPATVPTILRIRTERAINR